MSITDENKPKVRSRQRKGKAKQPEAKVDQRPNPQPRDDDGGLVELNEAPLVDADARPAPAEIEPVTAASAPCEGALAPSGPSPIALAGPLETYCIGFETISRAYRACAWRSIEETMDLFEKLSLARSFDKKVEVQNEFSRKTCDDLLKQSQNIWGLYSEFAGRMFRSFDRVPMWRGPLAR